jgi:PAS domain S-box-containing protein
MVTHAPLHCEVVRRSQAAPVGSARSAAPTGSSFSGTAGPRTDSQNARATGRPPADRKAGILIVEDGLIVAEDLRRRCESLGYHVVGLAHSGEQAVNFAGTMHPDVILMDIGLRGSMDGIEAARQIRERATIPVIYATAYSDEATLCRAKVTDPAGFLLKPIGSRELRAAIEIALVRSEKERDIRERDERHRLLVEAVSDGLVVVDANGCIMECTPRAALHLGCASTAPLVGKDLLAVFPAADRVRFAEALREVLSTGMAMGQTLSTTCPDGTTLVLSIDIRPMPGSLTNGSSHQTSVLLILRTPSPVGPEDDTRAAGTKNLTARSPSPRPDAAPFR